MVFLVNQRAVSIWLVKSQDHSHGRGPAAAFHLVQANKKEGENGLLIAREFRLFQGLGTVVLGAGDSAGLVTTALTHKT